MEQTLPRQKKKKKTELIKGKNRKCPKMYSKVLGWKGSILRKHCVSSSWGILDAKNKLSSSQVSGDREVCITKQTPWIEGSSFALS